MGHYHFEITDTVDKSTQTLVMTKVLRAILKGKQTANWARSTLRKSINTLGRTNHPNHLQNVFIQSVLVRICLEVLFQDSKNVKILEFRFKMVLLPVHGSAL